MPEYESTPNGYRKPVIGEPNWGTHLRYDIDLLDERVPDADMATQNELDAIDAATVHKATSETITGAKTFTGPVALPSSTEAGLPAAGTAGRVQRVSDGTRGLWMDQGTQWFSISGNVVNVKEFGAKGDGVTDDGTALTNAFAAVPAGGAIYLPYGTYLTSSTITRTTRIRIIADPGTLIRKTGAGHALVLGAGTVGNAVTGMVVQGPLWVSTESGGGDAVRILACHRGRFEISVPSCAAAGIRLVGSLLNELHGIVSTNLPYTAGTRAVPTHGVSLENGENGAGASGSNANSGTITAEGITTSPGYGINLDDADGCVFTGASEGNTVGVRWGTGVHDNALIGVYMEANGANESGTRGANTLISNVGAGTIIPFSDGSVTEPSITFSNDTNTGLRRIASDRVGLVLGGIDRVDFQTTQALFAVDHRPSANNTYDLGSSALAWRDIYANLRYFVAGNQVVNARKTGWAAATGTATRTTFATSTVTTAELAERVKALLDDLISHGLIGT